MTFAAARPCSDSERLQMSGWAKVLWPHCALHRRARCDYLLASRPCSVSMHIADITASWAQLWVYEYDLYKLCCWMPIVTVSSKSIVWFSIDIESIINLILSDSPNLHGFQLRFAGLPDCQPADLHALSTTAASGWAVGRPQPGARIERGCQRTLPGLLCWGWLKLNSLNMSKYVKMSIQI